MFTGIIQTVGQVVASQREHGDLSLVIDPGDIACKNVQIGDSIAVNGVCLTVVELTPGAWRFDVSVETLDRTLLGDLSVEDPVNLEPALTLNDALGGHLVSGHVDGVGQLLKREADGRSVKMVFSAPKTLGGLIAEKGSICIDGVSLTVNQVKDVQHDNQFTTEFEINIVPHTLEATTLGFYKPDQPVHLEVDQIARYVHRLLQYNTKR